MDSGLEISTRWLLVILKNDYRHNLEIAINHSSLKNCTQHCVNKIRQNYRLYQVIFWEYFLKNRSIIQPVFYLFFDFLNILRYLREPRQSHLHRVSQQI